MEKATCAQVKVNDRTVVVEFDTTQLLLRQEGDLITGEIVAVSWTAPHSSSLERKNDASR